MNRKRACHLPCGLGRLTEKRRALSLSREEDTSERAIARCRLQIDDWSRLSIRLSPAVRSDEG
jgi:hypothetical protein